MSQIGRHVATGTVADILGWGDRHVLKLYRHSPATAAREAALARAVHALGVPTPGVADVVTIDGRAGIIFERTDGPTMLERLAGEADRAGELARQLAALHADLHARDAAGLPGQRERLRRKIVEAPDLAAGARAAVLDALDALPDGTALCHGDFHPGNVIMTPSGPVIVDWPNATRGHPVADVARTLLLIEHAAVGPAPTDHGGVIAAMRAAFAAAYLEHYAGLRPLTGDDLQAWMIPVAAARLAERRSAAEHRALLALIDRWGPAS